MGTSLMLLSRAYVSAVRRVMVPAERSIADSPVGSGTTSGQVTENRDLKSAGGRGAHEVGADESGSTGDQDRIGRWSVQAVRRQKWQVQSTRHSSSVMPCSARKSSTACLQPRTAR